MEMDKPSLKRRVSNVPQMPHSPKKIRGVSTPMGTKDFSRAPSSPYHDSYNSSSIQHRPAISSTNGTKALNEARNSPGSPLAMNMESSHKDSDVNGRELKTGHGLKHPGLDRRPSQPRLRPTINTSLDSAPIHPRAQTSTPSSAVENPIHKEATSEGSGRSTPAPVAVMASSPADQINTFMRFCSENAVAQIKLQEAKEQLDTINKQLKPSLTRPNVESFPAYFEQKRNMQNNAQELFNKRMIELNALKAEHTKFAIGFATLLQPEPLPAPSYAKTDELEKQLRICRSDLDRTQRNLQSSQEEAKKMRELIDGNDHKRQAEAKSLNERVGQLRTDMRLSAQASKEFAAITADSVLKEGIGQCNKRIDKLELGSKQVEKDIANMSKQSSSLAQFDDLKSTAKTSTEAVQAMKFEVSKITSDLKVHKNEIENLQRDVKSTNESLANHSTIRSDMKNLGSKLAELAKKAESTADLATTVSEQGASIKSLTDQMNIHEQSIPAYSVSNGEQRKRRKPDSFDHHDTEQTHIDPQNNSGDGPGRKELLELVKTVGDLEANIASVEDLITYFADHTAPELAQVKKDLQIAVSRIDDQLGQLSADQQSINKSVEVLQIASNKLLDHEEKIESLESQGRLRAQNPQQSVSASVLEDAIRNLQIASQRFVETRQYSDDTRRLDEAITVNTTACRMLEDRFNHLTTDAVTDGIQAAVSRQPVLQRYEELYQRVESIENERLRGLEQQQQQLHDKVQAQMNGPEKDPSQDDLKASVESMRQNYETLHAQIQENMSVLTSTRQTLRRLNDGLPSDQRLPLEDHDPVQTT